MIINLSVSLSLDSSPRGEPLAKRASSCEPARKSKSLQRHAKSTASKAVFSQNRGSTPVCRSKPITAAIRAAILSFPQRAVRAHFTRRSANRLPANGPFSLSSSPLRYSARVNAFFLIHLYYSRAGGRSQAERRRRHFSGSSAPIQSISCFLQKCLLAKYIPAQMAMASTR